MLAKLKQMRSDQTRQKAKLLRKKEKIDAELATINRSLFNLERMITMEGDNKPQPLGIIEGAEQIFSTNGGAPMSIRQLTHQLQQLGVQTTSKRFGAAVYATIWSSPKFVRLPGKHGHFQRTQDAPPAAVSAWQKLQAKRLARVKKNRGTRGE